MQKETKIMYVYDKKIMIVPMFGYISFNDY